MPPPFAIAGDAERGAGAADEALARACERWSRVGSMASPTGWVFRTGVNLVLRTGRRRGLEARERRLLARSKDRAPGLDPYLSMEVREALATLPERERAICALFYVADRPVAEIAEVLSVSVGTVTSSLAQSRKRLRSLMTERTEVTPWPTTMPRSAPNSRASGH